MRNDTETEPKIDCINGRILSTTEIFCGRWFIAQSHIAYLELAVRKSIPKATHGRKSGVTFMRKERRKGKERKGWALQLGREHSSSRGY